MGGNCPCCGIKKPNPNPNPILQPIQKPIIIEQSKINYDENNNKAKEENYKNFVFKESIEGHENNVISLIELNNKKIMTGSYDKKIKIWNIHNFQSELTIEEEEKILCLLEFQPNMILIGTSSGKINLWDINSMEKVYIHLSVIYFQLIV